MKRRDFLKLSGAALAATALPALAKPKDNIVIRKGLPGPALKMLNTNSPGYRYENNHPLPEFSFKKINDTPDIFVGLDADTWNYRGWNVTYKYSSEEIEVYEAIRGDQYIHCEIDIKLLNLYLDGGYGTPHDYVNNELDAYIEAANAQWQGIGDRYDHVWEGEYDNTNKGIIDIMNAAIKKMGK